MKIKNFGSTVIAFLVILILSLTVSTDYNFDSADGKGGSSQSGTSGNWTTGTPMPTPRSEIAGAALNGKIYIIGGYEEGYKRGRNTSAVDVYDPITDKWAAAAPLPQPLDHAGAASHDGKLYVVGGGSTKFISNKLFIYDPAIDKWKEGANLPAARGAMSANFINGILYAIGGANVSGDWGDASRTTNTNQAYNPKTNTWTEKAPMPTARNHLTSAVVDGKLYAIGGRISDTETNVDANEVYDPVTDKWNILDSMPSKRSGLASADVNGTIYVFGGEELSHTFNNNEKYDPKTDRWRSDTPMPTARHGVVAVAIDDKIYVIGGGPEPEFSYSKVNEIFHPAVRAGILRSWLIGVLWI
jgi:N-acetylneuraminic acid mutarotase